MKKFVSFVLASAMTVAIGASLAACGEKPEGGKPSGGGGENPPVLQEVKVRTELKETTVRILLPSSTTVPDSANVVKAINQKLMKDGKPYTVQFEYAADGNYSVTLEDKAKEGYDAAWSHADLFEDLISKEVIKTNLMPYMEKWGQPILNDVPSYSFDQFIDYRTGGLCAIPRHMPTADDRMRLLVRKDWMEEAGIDEIKDIETLDKYFNEVQTRHGSQQGFVTLWPDYGNAHLLREYAPTYYFPCGSDTYPIYIDLSDPDLKVKNFFQTSVFRRWVEKSVSYVNQGLAPKEAKSGTAEALFYSGLCGAISDYSVVKLSERYFNFKREQVSGQLYDVFFESPTNKKWVMRGGDNCMVVLAKSQNVEELIDFFAWTKNQENHDLVTLGVKGVNYYLTDKGRITFTDPVTGEKIPETKRFSASAPYWAYNDITYQRWADGIDDAWIEETVNWEKNDENGNPVNYNVSPLNGFNIVHTSAYKIAIQKVSDKTASMGQLLEGRVANYDDVIAKMVADVNANGISELITEVQRQVDEFLAYKKSKA